MKLKEMLNEKYHKMGDYYEKILLQIVDIYRDVIDEFMNLFKNYYNDEELEMVIKIFNKV